MANKDDYLVDYSKFFKNFAETLNPNDPLPVKLGSYKLLNTEVIGGVIDWTTQYLNQKNCPKSLVAPLINITISKTREKCKLDPRACGFNVSDNAYEPLKLMKSVLARCNEICSIYLDNSLLCTLPPPNGHYHRHPVSECAVKNGRRRMEDRHVVIHDLNTILNLHEDVTPSSYYAVFDGHAGHDAAVYSATHLHQYLGESEHFPNNPEKALTEAFFKTDAYFVQKCEVENFSSGTTAVCALLRPQEKYLYIAWAGDSMALIANKGRILQCVDPHKPSRKDEQDRIEKAGGSVMFWGTWRVNGQLAVSRAIGDADFKPSVVATPDIQKVALDGGEDFIILACDGLWDFVNDDMAAKEVYTAVCVNPEDAQDISQVLVKLAKSNGSGDNISVIVVFLRDPRDIAADTQWLLDSSTSQDATRQPDSAAAMDSAAGLDNNASNPFPNNDASTTGELVQKDPFLLDIDSFKQQTTEISSVPNNDFFLGLDHSTNGKRSAEEMFDDDDFGPETNVDGDGIDNHQPEGYINDKNCFASDLDEKMETVKENDREYDERLYDECVEHISPTLLAAKAIADGVNNSSSPHGLLDRLEEEMDLAMEREFNQGGNAFAEEKITEKEDSANEIVADDVHDGNLVDNVADSGEESEDEWNYFKGNTAGDTDKENIDPTVVTRTVDNLEGDDFDMSQLNPNAAEFVPVSPTRSAASPPHMALINDAICAQSPIRVPSEPIDINVPEPNDFETEIRSRPSDVRSRNNGHTEPDESVKKSHDDFDNLLNGKNDVESDTQATKSTENFHFGPNATPFSTPAKFLDDSEAFSTKANFGDDTTAYLDCTTAFSPDKNVSTDSNNPFGDQTDFQAIMNKESDPMSMSFYQDKDCKSDTNPFDLNKVQMLPDDLDVYLSKPNEQNALNLPEHGQEIITDLDKPSQDEDLVSGIRELPKSPIEDVVTPEPTFDENLCPNNEVIEKENIENVSEKIDSRNESAELNDLGGQFKNMTVNDISHAESEIEVPTEESNIISEQPEAINLIEQQLENVEDQFVPQQEEPLLCVMKKQEGTDLIECHLEYAGNDAISPEPINQEIPTPEAVHKINEFSPEVFESPQVSNELDVEEVQQSPYFVERELIETPVDDVTSSIKDDISPVQLPTELIPDLPIDESTPAVVAEENSAPVVEAAIAAGAAVAIVASAAVISKKTSKDTPLKKPTTSKTTATPRSTPKAAATTPKVSATSPTKSVNKAPSATKAPTPKTTPAAKTSNATTTGKLSAVAPRPKTAPASAKPITKPLQNGESKPISKPLSSSTVAAPKPRVGALPLTKTTTLSAKAAVRLSPTKPLPSTRPATAPAAPKASAGVKPASTLGALSKPKPTATSVARASSATTKLTTTSVTKASSVTKTTTSTLTSASKTTATKTSAAVPATKPRLPITRTVPPKAPDAEKQNKENVNKLTASRTAAIGKSSALTNGKPATTARRIEPKVAGMTAKTTVTKTTTATTTRLTTAKKPAETNRPITKPSTKPITKTVVNSKSSAAKVNGLPNGLSEITTTVVQNNSDLINVVDNAMVVDDLVVKDNSPIMENSQLINATAAD